MIKSLLAAAGLAAAYAVTPAVAAPPVSTGIDAATRAPVVQAQSYGHKPKVYHKPKTYGHKPVYKPKTYYKKPHYKKPPVYTYHVNCYWTGKGWGYKYGKVVKVCRPYKPTGAGWVWHSHAGKHGWYQPQYKKWHYNKW